VTLQGLGTAHAASFADAELKALIRATIPRPKFTSQNSNPLYTASKRTQSRLELERSPRTLDAIESVEFQFSPNMEYDAFRFLFAVRIFHTDAQAAS